MGQTLWNPLWKSFPVWVPIPCWSLSCSSRSNSLLMGKSSTVNGPFSQADYENSQRVSFTHPTHPRVLRNRLEHFCFARPLPEPLMCATLGATAAAARSPLSKSCRKSNRNPFFHFSKKQSTCIVKINNYNLYKGVFNHQTIWELCGQSI